MNGNIQPKKRIKLTLNSIFCIRSFAIAEINHIDKNKDNFYSFFYESIKQNVRKGIAGLIICTAKPFVLFIKITYLVCVIEIRTLFYGAIILKRKY
jgi:acetylglutamate synthase